MINDKFSSTKKFKLHFLKNSINHWNVGFPNGIYFHVFVILDLENDLLSKRIYLQLSSLLILQILLENYWYAQQYIWIQKTHGYILKEVFFTKCAIT